jgi:peptidoglycan hydrolase-like protein with peptidoglycan-binding domain
VRVREREPAAWNEAFFEFVRLAVQDAANAVLRQRPIDTIAVLLAIAACLAIVVNAIALQSGPHPAPFFSNPAARTVAAMRAPGLEAVRNDAAALPRPTADIIADIQRELYRRGLYDGSIDGIYVPRTDSAIREFEQKIGKRPGALPTEALLNTILQSSVKPVRTINAAAPVATGTAARNDPIAQLLAPSASTRTAAVQRALADYGYGQIKPSGNLDRETQAAIEKFERAQKLPVTGQISDRLMRQLSIMTGRPLE